MAGLSSSASAKHHGNALSPRFLCVILLGLLSVSTANNICSEHKLLILKPTYTYSSCNVKVPVKVSRTAPTIAYPEDKGTIEFNLTTIVMLSPRGGNSVHWLRTNIPKERLAVGTSSRSDDYFKYRGPNPPQGTGEYIYQIYLLKQPRDGNITVEPYVDADRKNFKMEKFKTANGMVLLDAFQFRTEFEFNGSGSVSFSVILGVISVFWSVFLGV